MLQLYLPPLMLLDKTGKGSASWSDLIKMDTGVDSVISRKRLLTPWVDSFNKEVTFWVDSFSRSDMVGGHLLCPFKSLLSMLMAKRIEFSPLNKRGRKSHGEA